MYMRQVKPGNTAIDQRLLSLDDLRAYLGIGRTKAMQFGRECGAVRSFGRRTLYDRTVIDRAIDQMTE